MAWSSGGAIHAAVRGPAGVWGPDTVLATGRAIRAGPVLAIGGSGDAVVAWVRADSAVEAAVRSPSGGWSAAARIIGGPGPAGSPSVSVDATGRAVVVWLRRLDQSGRLSTVLAAEHGRGASRWSTPVTLAPSADAYVARSGVDGAGTVVAAWWGGAPDRVEVTSRAVGGVWRRPAVIPGEFGPIADLAVGPLGDIVISSGGTGSLAGFRLTTRAPDGPWRTVPVDVNLNAGRALVNGAGDALALASADPSDTQEQVFVSAGDAGADRPGIRTLRALGAPGPAAGIRLRIALTAAGRVLLTLTGPGGKTATAAAMVTVGARGALIPLPVRIARAMRRPGAYRISADTGARSLARGQRAISVSVRPA